MGGGVAAAVLEPLKAEISQIQTVNSKMAQALQAISNSIDGLYTVTQTMQAEMKAFQDMYKQQYNKVINLVNQNHNQTMCPMSKAQPPPMRQELDTLLTTGIGRTREFQMLLNPE